MIKQLKAVTTLGAMAMALMTAVPAIAQDGPFRPESFWYPTMMVKMDKNKDGMVSRQEFMDYMGAQFDIMDAKKKGMLTKAEFMDTKMMAKTFPPGALE